MPENSSIRELENCGVIERYDVLIERAHAIMDEAPYWQFIPEPQFSKLRIVGETATLVFCELESGSYDSGDSIVENTIEFPAEMLVWPEDRLEEWKKAQKKEYRIKEKQRELARIAELEAQERAVYLALKAKYD